MKLSPVIERKPQDQLLLPNKTKATLKQRENPDHQRRSYSFSAHDYAQGNELRVTIAFSQFETHKQKFAIKTGAECPFDSQLIKVGENDYQLNRFSKLNNEESELKISTQELEFTFVFRIEQKDRVLGSIEGFAGPRPLDLTSHSNCSLITILSLTTDSVHILSVKKYTTESQILSSTDKGLKDLKSTLETGPRRPRQNDQGHGCPAGSGQAFCPLLGSAESQCIPEEEICQNEVEATVLLNGLTNLKLVVEVQRKIHFVPQKMLFVAKISYGTSSFFKFKTGRNGTEYTVAISFTEPNRKLVATFDSANLYETTLTVATDTGPVIGLLISKQGRVASVGFAHGNDTVILRQVADFQWNTVATEGFDNIMELSFHRFDGSDQGFFSFVPTNLRTFLEDNEILVISMGSGVLMIFIVLLALSLACCVVNKR